MKIESLIIDAYKKHEKNDTEFNDFVLVCTEASKQIVSRLQTRNFRNILEFGFEEENITFYIDRAIFNSPLFEEYNINVNIIDDYLECGKVREKHPIIRTEVNFPINLLFESEYEKTLKLSSSEQ